MKGNNNSHTANFPELEKLDVSKLECIYQYTIMDTELQDSKETYRILQIGENMLNSQTMDVIVWTLFSAI